MYTYTPTIEERIIIINNLIENKFKKRHKITYIFPKSPSVIKCVLRLSGYTKTTMLSNH